LLYVLTGYSDEINSVAFGPDGQLALGCDDHIARIWPDPKRIEDLLEIERSCTLRALTPQECREVNLRYVGPVEIDVTSPLVRLDARAEPPAAVDRPVQLLNTPAGPVLRYSVGDTDFVLVDSSADGHVVSWSSASDAVTFLQLCRRLSEQEADTHGIVVVNGERIAGPGRQVLDAVAKIDGRLVAESCDFIRFDLPLIDVAFHRMPGPAQPEVVISAVSAGPFGPDLGRVAGQTATARVAAAVHDVAPLREGLRQTQPEVNVVSQPK
jgi:hypothetical protein